MDISAGFRPMWILSWIMLKIFRFLIGFSVSANDTLIGWILDTFLFIK